MDLLIVEEGHAFPSPEAYNIEPFRSLIRRDRGTPGDSQGRLKAEVSRQLAYVYHMTDHRSPYMQSYTDEEQRSQVICDDIWGKLETSFSPDDLVEECIQKYKELTDSPVSQLLKSGYGALMKLKRHYDTLDLTERDDNNRLVNNPKDVISSLANLGKVVKSIEELEDQVRKKMDSSANIRGGAEVNRFSE